MIELLIVIAVLGILAVAVLAAINPIEQINRSKDTGSRSDSEQLIGGVDRFYTQKGYYPWQDNPSDGQATLSNGFLSMNDLANAFTGKVLNNLTGSTGELKDAFKTRIPKPDYNSLYLHNDGAQGSSSYLCFKPQSKAFLDDAWKRCVDVAGSGLPSDLVSAATEVCSASDNAFSCLP